MRIFLIAVSILCISSGSSQGQCFRYRGYAFCNDSLGHLYYYGICDNLTWLWSTGSISSHVTVPVGTYTVLVTDTLSGSSHIDTLIMLHDSWHVDNFVAWGPAACDSSGDSDRYTLQFTPMVNGVGLMFSGPSCLPTTFTIVIWRDSIPIDTLSDYLNQFGQGIPQSYCVPSGHTYDLTITDFNCNCTFGTWGTQSLYLPSNTSIPEKEKLTAISITPNPINTYFDLHFINTHEGNGELTIYSSTGQVVRRQTILLQDQRLNLEKLNNGMYFIHIVSEKASFNCIKILK